MKIAEARRKWQEYLSGNPGLDHLLDLAAANPQNINLLREARQQYRAALAQLFGADIVEED